MLLALSAFSTAAWAQAGRVNAICGQVSMLGTSGGAVAVKVGDSFELGTSFNTGTDGRLVIQFADGQSVALGPSSAFQISEYRFVAGNIKASRSAVGLLNGTMRYVTGAIHAENPEAVHISAGRSTIDILNAGMTDFTLVVDATAEETGVASVTAGEIAVNMQFGRIARITTGQFARWQSARAATLPAPLAAAPAVIQAEVTALQAARPPTQTPMYVECPAFEAVLAALAGAAPLPARAPSRPYFIPTPTPGGGGGCVGSPC